MESTPPAAGTPNALMVVLSYLFPLSLIPLFTDKSADIQFHAKQGIALGLVIWAINIVASVLFMITSISLISLVAGLLSLALFVFAVIAIVKGLGGELYRIPVIGDLVGKVPTP